MNLILNSVLLGELSPGAVAPVANRRPETLILTGGRVDRRGPFTGLGVSVEVTLVGPLVGLVFINDVPTIRIDHFVFFRVDGPVHSGQLTGWVAAAAVAGPSDWMMWFEGFGGGASRVGGAPMGNAMVRRGYNS